MDDEHAQVLIDLLDWAIGNRGAKTGNPYRHTEVTMALHRLATWQGRSGWASAVTAQGIENLGRVTRREA